MIEEIKQYKTSDGNVFDDYEKAINHENKLNETKQLEKLQHLIDSVFNYLPPETRNHILVGVNQHKNEFFTELSTLLFKEHGISRLMPFGAIARRFKDQLNKKSCPQCGLDLSSGVMSYACMNSGCPTGLGPTTMGPIKIKVK